MLIVYILFICYAPQHALRESYCFPGKEGSGSQEYSPPTFLTPLHSPAHPHLPLHHLCGRHSSGHTLPILQMRKLRLRQKGLRLKANQEKLELSLPISDPYLESLSLVTSSWGGEDDQKKAAKTREETREGRAGEAEERRGRAWVWTWRNIERCRATSWAWGPPCPLQQFVSVFHVHVTII